MGHHRQRTPSPPTASLTLAVPWAPPWSPPAGARWALSRRRRNRLQHALNGNPAAAGRGRSLDWRALHQPQSAKDLRRGGWTLPADVPADTLLRLYDTRVDPAALQQLATEVASLPVVTVGGDFLTAPAVSERRALAPVAARWGRLQPTHLVVPPREHLSRWAKVVARQLQLESEGTLLTVCVRVKRADLADTWPSALRALPAELRAAADATDVRTQLSAVGWRVPLLRIPASCRTLPPPEWERGWLPRDSVLLLCTMQRVEAGSGGGCFRWIGNPAPEPTTDDGLELMWAEMALAPATKEKTGRQLLEKALRHTASALGYAVAPLVRSTRFPHEAVQALVGVPRAQATRWMRGSGCGGLFVRPYYTDRTQPSLHRDLFRPLDVPRVLPRGAAAVWEALQNQEGFAGLATSGKHLRVRVLRDADARPMMATLQAAAGEDLAVVDAEAGRLPGRRWWVVRALHEHELHAADELVQAFGLREPAQSRRARDGRFRWKLFVQAVGPPTRTTLDDGGWGAPSEARLELAPPPPPDRKATGRVPPKKPQLPPLPRSAAKAARPRGNPANGLPATSTWAGAHTNTGEQPNDLLMLRLLATVEGLQSEVRELRGNTLPPKLPPKVPPKRAPVVPPANPDPAAAPFDALMAELTALRRDTSELRAEMRALREENAELRRENATLRSAPPARTLAWADDDVDGTWARGPTSDVPPGSASAAPAAVPAAQTAAATTTADTALPSAADPPPNRRPLAAALRNGPRPESAPPKTRPNNLAQWLRPLPPPDPVDDAMPEDESAPVLPATAPADPAATAPAALPTTASSSSPPAPVALDVELRNLLTPQYPELAPRITRELLRLPVTEVRHLLTAPAELARLVEEAIQLLGEQVPPEPLRGLSPPPNCPMEGADGNEEADGRSGPTPPAPARRSGSKEIEAAPKAGKNRAGRSQRGASPQ